MNHKRLLILSAIMAALLSQALYASGRSSGGFSNRSDQTPKPRQIDEAYEYGKAIFLGRNPGTKAMKYCLLVDGEAKIINRNNIKRYKGTNQSELANALYDCDEPENLALRAVNKEQIPYVLYYLNKRYKLNLHGAS